MFKFMKKNEGKEENPSIKSVQVKTETLDKEEQKRREETIKKINKEIDKSVNKQTSPKQDKASSYMMERFVIIEHDKEYDEEVKEIIDKIKQVREEKGISQRQLAAMADIPQSSIARIETMTIIPRLNTLVRIIKPLGISLDFKEE